MRTTWNSFGACADLAQIEWVAAGGYGFVEHGDDVLRGDVGLDAMDGGEDVAAAGGEVLDAAADFGPDVAGGAAGEDPTGVDGAAEGEAVAEFALEAGGVAHGAGGNMNGIEEVDTGLDEVV